MNSETRQATDPATADDPERQAEARQSGRNLIDGKVTAVVDGVFMVPSAWLRRQLREEFGVLCQQEASNRMA